MSGMKRLLAHLEELPGLIERANFESGPRGSNDGEHEVLDQFTEWAESVLTDTGLADKIPTKNEDDEW